MEQLFAGKGPQRRYKELNLPVRGCKVRIQSLTEWEVSEYQAVMVSSRGGATAYIRGRLVDASRRLIVLCLVDGAGNRILNKSHVELLADWDAADATFLYTECAAFCGINREDIEDLAKNSSTTTVEG